MCGEVYGDRGWVCLLKLQGQKKNERYLGSVDVLVLIAVLLRCAGI